MCKMCLDSGLIERTYSDNCVGYVACDCMYGKRRDLIRRNREPRDLLDVMVRMLKPWAIAYAPSGHKEHYHHFGE